VAGFRIGFEEMVGGRPTPGRPSPYRAMTWRELLDEDMRLIRQQVAIAREKDRRIRVGVFDPAPLRLVEEEDTS